MSSGPTSWAQTRQALRVLEDQTKSEFNTLSQYATASATTLEPSIGETGATSRIQQLVQERDACLDTLRSSIAGEQAAKSSAVKHGHLHTHSTRLADDRAELARILASIDTQRRKAAHLSTVHSSVGTGLDEETRQLLREQSSLERSDAMVGSLISRAFDTRQNLIDQNETIANINRRLAGAVTMFPGMTTLMSKITHRQKRDSVILGSFMALCFLFFFYIS